MITLRRLFVPVGVALIALAITVVEVPLTAFTPAPAVTIEDHLAVQDGDDLSGDFMLTAVEIAHPTFADLGTAVFDDDTEVVFNRRVVPPGVDPEEFIRLQREIFIESAKVAGAVAMEAAGLDVSVSGGGVRVADVIDGSPADGVIRQGDVITHVDGERVRLASALAALTMRARAGEVVELTIQRGDRTTTEEIHLERIDRLDRPGLGVAIRTLSPELELPLDLDLDLENVGGASAGLMMALTVYDSVDDTDLLDGRQVAGTGTLDLMGMVGEISEIDLKVLAAERAGADLFLVPASQAEAARGAAGSIEVVPVRSFDEAVEALEAR